MNNKYILLGLENNKSQGSFHGSEWFESFSMEGTQVTVIKEGNLEDITSFVGKMREKGNKAKKLLDELEDRVEDLTLSEKEYEMEFRKHMKDMELLNYDKLIAVEGIVF